MFIIELFNIDNNIDKSILTYILKDDINIDKYVSSIL